MPHVRILEDHVSPQDWPSDNGILPVGGGGGFAEDAMRERHVLVGIFWDCFEDCGERGGRYRGAWLLLEEEPGDSLGRRKSVEQIAGGG